MEQSKMKMFREAVVKMANSYANKPLSDDQNNLIRDQFNRLFSVQQHTPDHPPYAWMIERALRELNEKGGSTEESISNFIRKEYDDLPWFHSTLLNHHLLELCKCGSIFLTRGRRYSLVNADSSFKSGKKGRRKQKKRKRAWDWQIKQRKLRRKCIRMKLLQKKDQVHEKYNCIVKETKQQNIEADMKKELCIVGDDKDHAEISTPEVPPGYDAGTFKGSSHLSPYETEDPSWRAHLMRKAPEIMVFLAKDLSEPQEQIQVFNVNDQLNYKKDQINLSKHEAAVTSVNKTLQHVRPITRTGEINSQCIMEENPAIPSQKGSSELHSQKVPPKTAFYDEPVNLGRGEGERYVVFKYQRRRAAKEKDISCRIQNRKEEQMEERQLKCPGQNHLDGNDAIASSFLQQHLQEHGFSYSNKQENVKFTTPGKRSPKQLKCILALPAVLDESGSKRFNHLAQHHAKRRVSLEGKPLHRVLPQLQSMPQQPETIATDDVQKQPKYNLRSRSLKVKPLNS